MSVLSELWAKLAATKEYRHALVASELKRGLPRQVRILRKQRGWNQQRVARESGLTQGAISRAENPDYGNLTLNNLLHLGMGLDVAFVGKFVPFSDFAKWHASLRDESQLEVPSFNEDTCSERKGPSVETHLVQKVGGYARPLPALAASGGNRVPEAAFGTSTGGNNCMNLSIVHGMGANAAKGQLGV